MEPEKLIRVYGFLEGLIGLYALCFPLGLSLLEKLYPLILPESAAGWIDRAPAGVFPEHSLDVSRDFIDGGYLAVGRLLGYWQSD